jgi:hypothetical protein
VGGGVVLTREEFKDLMADWEEDMMFVSSTTQIMEHENYSKLLEAGKDIMPWLMEEIHESCWIGGLCLAEALEPEVANELGIENIAGHLELIQAGWVNWWEGEITGKTLQKVQRIESDVYRETEMDDGKRVETGALAINGDWPGLFVRGDDAIKLAYTLFLVEDKLNELELDLTYTWVLRDIKALRELIFNDVKCRVPGSFKCTKS